MNQLVNWLLIIIAVEAGTEIVVASELFFGMRAWLLRENNGLFNRLKIFCGKLMNCGYCFSVWVAGLAVYLWGTTDLWKWLLMTLVIHRCSNLFHELTSRYFKRLPLVLVVSKLEQAAEPQLQVISEEKT